MQLTNPVVQAQLAGRAPRIAAPRVAPQRQAPPAPITAARRLLDLQRTHGNAFVQRMIQCKLSVSTPGDPFEREADQVAESVVRSVDRPPAPAAINPKEEPDPVIHRVCADCKEEIGRQAVPPEQEKKEEVLANVQRQESGEEEREPEVLSAKSAAPGQTEVPDDVESSIQHLAGGGGPLAPPVRAEMESSMGFDFGGVRVHHDGQANQLARSVNALAFTYGNNIVFGGSQYQPGTTSGKRLLAHELTHVVQQTGGVPIADQGEDTNGSRR